MFIAKKIITAFLLPPGIFVVLLLSSGMYFLFKKNWRVGIMNCFIGIFIWALSISPVADAMLRGLESDFEIPPNPRGDVIILLGGGAYDKAPDLSGTGVPSEVTLGRIVTAVRLQKRLNIPVIVSGGKVYKHEEADAPIVKRFLIDLGVPADMVIIEDRSRDTIENARFAKEICDRYNFTKPILVTSAFHMRRAVMSFEKIKMRVTPFPAYFITWEDKKYGWRDYLPEISDLKKSYMALHEYLGRLYYKFAY